MSLSKEKIEDWMAQLLRSHGFDVVRWNDGSMGLLNVPAKYCGVITDLTTALFIVSEGKPLPKLLPRGKGKTVRR